MVKYGLKRTIQSIPLVIAVLVISFFVVHLMPGDPITTLLGDKAVEEQVIRMKAQLHLDRPLPEQFLIWLRSLLSGNWGESILWKRPVIEILVERMEPTLLLAVAGTAISVAIGVPFGILAASHEGRFIDKALSVISLFSISLPAFWIAIIMIQLLAIDLGLFPVAGYHSISESGLSGALRDLMLPSLVLGVMHSGQIGRMTKNAMLEIQERNYLKTVRAMGVPEIRVISVYALKNAMTPILVVVGYSFANLLAGAVVVEQLFNIPGLGNLMISSILNRDYPVIQASLLVAALIFIGINLLTDLVCGTVNPRMRFSDE